MRYTVTKKQDPQMHLSSFKNELPLSLWLPQAPRGTPASCDSVCKLSSLPANPDTQQRPDRRQEAEVGIGASGPPPFSARPFTEEAGLGLQSETGFAGCHGNSSGEGCLFVFAEI